MCSESKVALSLPERPFGPKWVNFGSIFAPKSIPQSTKTVRKTKSEKVANYAAGIIHEVETLAHSVGADEPRQIRRKHIRVMQANGRSISLAKLYPRPDVLPGN